MGDPFGIRVNVVTPGLVTDEPLRRAEAKHLYLNMMIEMTPNAPLTLRAR